MALRAPALALGLSVAGPGCAPAPAPPVAEAPPGAQAPPPTEPPPPERAWRRVARIEADQPAAVPVEGAAEALARCAEVRPCVVERWVPAEEPPAAALTLLRRGAALEPVEDTEPATPWRTRWTVVNGALDPCLGDPLAASPADDPAGVRELVERGEARWWRLRLSGHNRCRLAGVLELSTTRDEAVADGLSVEGRPWREGGRQRALELLRADLRAQAQAAWEDLSPAEREEWARVLDRDPEAAALLEELRAREAPPEPGAGAPTAR